MLRNVYLIIKRGAFESGPRSLSTANVNYMSSSEEATKIKSKNEYFKAMRENQEMASEDKPAGWDEALPLEKMPGPKPLPLLGNIWRFIIGELIGKDFIAIHKIMNEKYGKMCLIRKMIGNQDFVVMYSAEEAEELFRNEGVWPIRDNLHSLEHYRKEVRKDLFGDNTGLATEQGEKWYKFRTIVNPILMQPRVTVQYVNKMDMIAQEFIENMRRMSLADPKRQMPDDFGNELNKWALESMGVIAIDQRLGCLSPTPNPEAQQIIDSVLEIFDLVFRLDFGLRLWKTFPTRDYKRFIEVENFVSGLFKKYIDEAHEKIKNSTVQKPVNEQSVLEKLLKIDKNIAFVMAIDMLSAGIDTTSKTSGGVLYYLAKNPRAQSVLREELIRLLPTKDTPITKETLEDAAYLKATIKESLRFSPIAIGNGRRSQKDMVLGGYRIPKGTQCVAMNLLMAMKDFPKADEFIPERWLRTTNDELSHKNVNPFTTLPFGFGPRSCIGKRLANLEIETIVAKVIRNFRLEWHRPELRFRQRLIYGFIDPLKLTVHDI